MSNHNNKQPEILQDAPYLDTAARQNCKPIVDHVAAQETVPEHIAFDPTRHLANAPVPKTITMREIGYAEDTGVSPVGVSMPFQLFSPEAIQQMRREIFQPEVMANHSFSSNIAACQLRGYAKQYAPFTYAAWTHPETLAILSKIAGVDIVPLADYEIAHINLSVKTDEQTQEELSVLNKQKRPIDDDEGIHDCTWKDDKPVVGWHTDSYPFVCVLMMSDCTNMVGGETALRTSNGDVMKVRGPQEGCAVILQGRYITHQALRALGAKERITAVTSFRPRSAMMKDDTVLTTVRPISDLSELYHDFAEYRLEIMEERIRQQRLEMAARRRASEKFNTLGHKKFLEEAVAFMEHTNNEIVAEDKVIPGFVEQKGLDGAANGAKDDADTVKRTRLE
jgi:hypothetical protein